jgi:DNA-binding transcriptional regulator YdaS (Cro superfamily)
MQEKHRIALLKACRIAGGQKQLAEKINVHPSRLNKWINRNKGALPYPCALEIENATAGQVTCYELVPKWEKVVEACQRNLNKTHEG